MASGWSPGGFSFAGCFFCWSGHPLLLLPLDYACPSLPGMEVNPQRARRGACPWCWEVHPMLPMGAWWDGVVSRRRFFGLPQFVHTGNSLLLESCSQQGNGGASNGGLWPKTPTLFQRRQRRQDEGWMKWSPEVLSGVGDPEAAFSPPQASVIWNRFYFLSGSPGLVGMRGAPG